MAGMLTIPALPYDFALPPPGTALIVIDMQRDFIEPGGFGAALGNDVSTLQPAIEPVRRLLGLFRARGWPIIHTRESHRPDLTDCPPAKRLRSAPGMRIGDEGPMGRILVRGEPGAAILESCAPLPGETEIDKPGKGRLPRNRPAGDPAGEGHHPPRLRRRHDGGLRADDDARGQRPRLRIHVVEEATKAISRPSRKRRSP